MRAMKKDLFTKYWLLKKPLVHAVASLALGLSLLFFLNTIDRVQADSLAASLKAIFRNDNLLGNTAAVGRRIADLEALKVIECVTLNSNSIGQIYSTSFKDGCDDIRLVHNESFTGTFHSLAGDTIEYTFRIPRNFAFTLTSVVLAFSLLIVINGALIWFWSANNIRETKLKLLIQIAEQAEQVSHDIRSPLSALMFAVRGLAHVPEENRKIIALSTKRIEDIANDLLKKRSFDRNGQSLNASFQNVKMVELISNICLEKELEIPSEKRITIKKDLGLEDADCPVDSAKLARIISNLINNSIDAIADEGAITIGLRINKVGHVVILVNDSGAGIPEDILKKLGNEKVESRKSGKSGSGIGLYYIQQRLAEMGGSMTIQSRVGVGTLVTILLKSTAEAN
jgi:signal transduction histidine kinase